jgi:hypothetical protein
VKAVVGMGLSARQREVLLKRYACMSTQTEVWHHVLLVSEDLGFGDLGRDNPCYI